MRILALDAALAGCSAALVADDAVIAVRSDGSERGQAARLPGMVAEVLAAARVGATGLDGVAVTVGPGSFTGLRAAIALAQGVAAGAGCPAVGVTVAEAMAEALPRLGHRRLWVALDSRRGRVFLHRGGPPEPVGLDVLPLPEGPVAVAGDAAIAVTARLAARGYDVMLTDVRTAPIRQVALVGARRIAGALAPLAAAPLYVDPPEARPPAGGLRAAPVPAGP